VKNEGGHVVSIWRRDSRRCWICRRAVPEPEASRDHVRPRSEGGYAKARNYRLAHRECNSARGALPEDEVRRIADERLPCSREWLCAALRVASKAYYQSEEHAALHVGVPPYPETALRRAKVAMKESRRVARLRRAESRT
jgi:hypothetical protein